MIYKLCYITGNKAYFTSNFEKQWGDDWNDRPYEHNAGEPYKYDYSQPEQGIENGVGIYPEIKQKIIYFEVPCISYLPCDGHTNSPYSVEDINHNRCPWLTLSDKNKQYYIFAGTSYTEFVKQIEKLDGTIYTAKKRSIL